MPMYEYECQEPACGHKDDEYQSIHDGHLSECPACGRGSYRRLISCPSGAMEREFHKPIEMHSIAPCTPEQIADFRRRNPDVDFNADGVPLARTRKQKLQILKNEGFVETK